MSTPLWFKKVAGSIKQATEVAKKNFLIPGTIIGLSDDEKFYLIRLEDKFGYFDKNKVPKELPIGTRMKNFEKLEFEKIDDSDKKLANFIFSVLNQNLKLVPRLWLYKTIQEYLETGNIKYRGETFKNWILLPAEKKKDRNLMILLEYAIKYEGLKGLMRYNDLAL